MLDWFIPWNHIDWGLKIQLFIWIAAIVFSYWIFWRTLIRKRPWLASRRRPTAGRSLLSRLLALRANRHSAASWPDPGTESETPKQRDRE
jgi:hypothetical protein